MDTPVKLNGMKIDGRKLPRLKLVECLYYYDGELLSIYKNNKNEAYIYLVCDEEKKYLRSCYAPVSNENIELFLKNKLSLYKILEQSDYIIFHDGYFNGRTKAYVLVDFANFPKEYMPEKDCILSVCDMKEEEFNDVMKKLYGDVT